MFATTTTLYILQLQHWDTEVGKGYCMDMEVAISTDYSKRFHMLKVTVMLQQLLQFLLVLADLG